MGSGLSSGGQRRRLNHAAVTVIVVRRRRRDDVIALLWNDVRLLVLVACAAVGVATLGVAFTPSLALLLRQRQRILQHNNNMDD